MDVQTQELARAIATLAPKTPDWCLAWQYQWDATCMSKAEWAGWVQAIGATVAFLWGVWLFRNAKRKAYAEAINLAEFEAVNVARMLIPLKDAIEFHAQAFRVLALVDGGIELFARFGERMALMQIPSRDQMRSLNVLLGQSTHHLAQAMGLLEDAKLTVEVSRPVAAGWDGANRKSEAGIMADLLDACLSELQVPAEKLAPFAIIRTLA